MTETLAEGEWELLLLLDRHKRNPSNETEEAVLAHYRKAKAEADRLRKIFDDAGQGEHNVLALIDHYQAEAIEAEADADRYELRLHRIGQVLADVGCDCDCDHHHDDEHDDDCERCLGCRIEDVLTGSVEKSNVSIPSEEG